MVIQELSFRYPRHNDFVFRDFSLSFREGRIYGLLGPNGAGKSTLLYLMAGLLTPDGGRVSLDGVDVRLRLPTTMREIFLVPDEFELPRVTLTEYIATNSVFYPHFSLTDMQTYLNTFGMTMDVRLDGLSLGQRKKIFMSFAMAAHTKVLLMDEPTNGLDIPGKRQFREFITQGLTDDRIFVVSTHQVKDIESIIGHVLLIDRSEIIRDEPLDGTADLESYFEQAMQGREAHHD
ncbi:ABC transporter ATP-binding protein [Prevotella sp.]|uniref:ABC transporter ATP-binding protein n=1 Tax=Prevotella sp. TaxID=59823 RepID=UPI002F929E73